MVNLDQCYNIFDLREAAQRRLPKGIFEYVDKGTEDGISLEENRAAFQRLKLHTHFLNDWSERDLDRKSTRLNSSHIPLSRMPSSA